MRIDRREQQLPPRFEPHRAQVIGLAREILHPVELRHRQEASVEPEAPAVIAAAQHRLRAFVFADQIAAMRADVREAAQAIGAVARQEERLVEDALDERHRTGPARHAHAIRIRDELPAPREHPIGHPREQRRIGVGP